jgi:hypothetical protein
LRLLLSSRHWNSKNQPAARVGLLCITVWCWVIPNTMVSNRFTISRRTLSRQSSLGHGHDQTACLASIMAPLLCRQIQSGMLGFLFLFSASAMTDTGSTSFECALVSTLETYYNPESGNYYYNYFNYTKYVLYSLMLFRLAGICRLQGPIRARLQETNSLCRPC